ncbi:hypothetical protein LTR50_005583 [Elasticomyces elasticus]|nr:hypothetical protein LTR50_005583 [Elasticomyces elasticus]
MASSRAFAQGRFLSGEERAGTDSQKCDSDGSNRRRQATLYDAVAGRVTSKSFNDVERRPSKYRDTIATSHQPVAPEEVLYRRRGAPERYAETDDYSAHKDLSSEQKLPSSDLLKALHTYASDFYASAIPDDGSINFRSMDETALLAFGILVEEAAKNAIGETGDLAFTEGENEDLGSGSGGPMVWDGERWVRSVVSRKRRAGIERKSQKRKRHTQEKPA